MMIGRRPSIAYLPLLALLVLLVDPVVALSRADAPPDHYEVLVRMRDDEGGLASPAGFMPVAERHGLAARIDRWVVRRVLVSGVVSVCGVMLVVHLLRRCFCRRRYARQ